MGSPLAALANCVPPFVYSFQLDATVRIEWNGEG